MSDDDKRRAYSPPEVVERGKVKVRKQPGPTQYDMEWLEATEWLEFCTKGCSGHRSCPRPKPQGVGWQEHCRKVYKELKERGGKPDVKEPSESGFTVEWWNWRGRLGQPGGLPDHNTPGFEDEVTQKAVLSFLKRLDDIDGRERTKDESWSFSRMLDDIDKRERREEERRDAAIRLVGLAHGHWWFTEGPGKHVPIERDAADTRQSRRNTLERFKEFQCHLEELPPSARANVADTLEKCLPERLAHALFVGDIPNAGTAIELLELLLDAAVRGLGPGKRPGAPTSVLVFLLADHLHSYLGRLPKAPEMEALLKILFGKKDKTAVKGMLAALRREEEGAKAAIAAKNRRDLS